MTAAVTDFSQFAALRAGAGRHDPATLRAVAGQFEALFIETLLKNVREASLADPIFGQSDQYDMYRGILDRQLSVEMASGRGIGLAEMLVRQLGGETHAAAADGVPAGSEYRLPARAAKQAVAAADAAATQADAAGEAAADGKAAAAAELAPSADIAASAEVASARHASGAPGAAAATEKPPAWSSPVEFARAVWPHALNAARKIGVAPEAILAQAALESGWGQHVMQRADGSSSFNLFGIKAGAGWQGPSATRPTVEYVDGVARRETARFRAYADLSETFDDYARLLGEHPRYAAVRNRGGDTQGFARALQSAGYATDPAYADKIGQVLRSGVLKEALGALKHFASRPIQP